MKQSKETLLSETIKILKQYGKTPKDVVWCGSEGFGSFSWEVFAQLADVEYDSGFGHQEVAGDLLIVGNGFWLERGEYDGSEWWEYKTMPVMPAAKVPKAVTLQEAGASMSNIYISSDSLADLHGEEEE